MGERLLWPRVEIAATTDERARKGVRDRHGNGVGLFLRGDEEAVFLCNCYCSGFQLRSR